jgi:hypothetical protein
MTHEEKVTYLRIAMSIQSMPVPDKIADQIITTYEGILEKGGLFNLRDAVEIEQGIKVKYETIKKEETK